MSDALLSVRGLEAGYGGSQVLFGVDLDVGYGEVVSLLGRNGMGKTTTVLSIMGLLPARAGEANFTGAGRLLTRQPPFRIAQCRPGRSGTAIGTSSAGRRAKFGRHGPARAP